MDCSGRTHRLAFAAKFALGRIDIGDIVLYNNSIMSTGLGAYSTTDAGGSASFLGGRALVLIAAGNIHSHTARAFQPKLNQRLGASLCTGPASGTFLLIDYGKTGNGIHRESPELTRGHAVSASETSEGASGIAAVEGCFQLARRIALIVVDFGQRTTATIGAFSFTS